MADPIFDVPSRRWTEAKRYVPVRQPSGDATLWTSLALFAVIRQYFVLLVIRHYFQFQGYLLRWEYASHKPVARGRHAKPEATRGPRHVDPTPLLAQLGITQRLWSAYVALDERVETAARTA